MWCLGRYLPLLIGDLIPEDDEHRENFLRLMCIVDYILAPVCTANIVAHLGHQIQLFLTDFKTLYPESNLTPKMHYLVHYPDHMLRYTLLNWLQWCYARIQLFKHRFGPPSRFWCMRYKAKNSYFKRIAQAVGNFGKNCSHPSPTPKLLQSPWWCLVSENLHYHRAR